VDAGSAQTLGKTQAVDLRTALLTAFPDGRGMVVDDASASLQRQLRYHVPHGQALNELMRPPILEKGFRPPQAGDPPMVLAMKPPFALMGSPIPGGLTLELALPLTSEDFGKLVQTPSPMTTEQLQSIIPTPKAAKVLSDTFFFSVQYHGEPGKADLRLRGLIAGLEDTGWVLKTSPPGFQAKVLPDAGALLDAGTAQPLLFELEKPAVGAKLRASIAGGAVAVNYVQPLVTHDPAP
jgi:hypothetical protein